VDLSELCGCQPPGLVQGHVGRVSGYDSALSDDDVARVRGYLATKYGVSL